MREHVGADKTAPFALADSRGRIRYVVSAEKRVPLNRYLHGRVGVRGRVYYGEYAHLIVDKIDLGANDNSDNPRATKTTPKTPIRQVQVKLPQASFEDEVDPPPTIGRVVQVGGCDCGSGDCSAGNEYDSGCGPNIDLGAVCDGGCSGPTRSADSTIWVRGEYLYWWADGLNTPPLVTTADSVENLPLPTGQILFGNEPILDEVRSGAVFGLAVG